MCEDHGVKSNLLEEANDSEEISIPQEGSEYKIPQLSDCEVVCYFNSREVTHDVELKRLQQYTFPNGHVADGIGLFINELGHLGVAYWYATPTEKDPKHGVWVRRGYLRRDDMLEFQQCFKLMNHRVQLHEQSNKTLKALEAKGVHGFAIMLDDRYRQQFSQVAHMTVKINQVFRKIWFKKNRRDISKYPF